jgi:hypothetical protein
VVAAHIHSSPIFNGLLNAKKMTVKRHKPRDDCKTLLNAPRTNKINRALYNGDCYDYDDDNGRVYETST